MEPFVLGNVVSGALNVVGNVISSISNAATNRSNERQQKRDLVAQTAAIGAQRNSDMTAYLMSANKQETTIVVVFMIVAVVLVGLVILRKK